MSVASQHFFLPRYMPSLCALPGWWPVHTPPPGTTSLAAAWTTSAPSTAWRLGRETSGSAGNYLAIQVRACRLFLWVKLLNQWDASDDRAPVLCPWGKALLPNHQTMTASFAWLIERRATLVLMSWDISSCLGHCSYCSSMLLYLRRFCFVKWYNMDLFILQISTNTCYFQLATNGNVPQKDKLIIKAVPECVNKIPSAQWLL